MFSELVKNQKLQKVWDLFPDALLVGGATRDTVLGRTPKDFDFSLPQTPNEVISVAIQNNIKYLTHGIKHGTVTIILDSEPFELTTFRKDYNGDGRHADVEWATSPEEDSLRRDFTCNAIYLNRHGELVGDISVRGVSDLTENRPIYSVRPFEEMIVEDHLRILRYYRMMGMTSSPRNPESSHILTKHSKSILKLSRERITSEILKILDLVNFKEVILEMKTDSILDILFSDLNLDRLMSLNGGNPITKLTALTSDFSNLVLSNAQKRQIGFLSREPMLNENMNEELNPLLFLYNRELLVEKSYMEEDGDWSGLRKKLLTLPIPKFPLTRHDFPDLHGKELGDRLKQEKDDWLKRNCK